MDAVHNSFCIFEPDGGDWVALRLRRLTPGERERPNTYWIRICVGPSAGQNVVVIYDIYS